MLNHNEKKVLDYFHSKRLYKNGFLKYSFFSKKIKYLIGDELSVYERRKIFNNLVKLDYFITQTHPSKNKYLYQLRTTIYRGKEETITLIFE
tara:strand:- start:173 stop:448 length:276 start_codon:yes stop_codon:yes gene_type:complete